ncbi:MAG: Nif3-like dinuclear metal center hexameric protein [Hydrotalea flava]|uniref:Nif3-like dinuclear metal center hexameric protein n=1 Tax=Hydrotalea TaxID=1004300 RepID=UPI00094511BF|nr:MULTISPECIES: Nif3-like dinuclear metal center hexameric protein [Hydrotalea]MBY0348145.1 Nif3-like dinuclear metal center hexameric protein [Hydrotalea flava]RWZ89090.1 MAG: Nif3-like dinuclear metal center hexameric protein [Hydrotalea sp. AMD]
MKIGEITQTLEDFAAPAYQESYDNARLLVGNSAKKCTGVLCTLDVTEAVIQEAHDRKCNLVVAHHPIIFKGLQKITGSNYVERTIIKAIQQNIAIYAIHTNLDNVINGVNGILATKLGLTNTQILLPKPNTLNKLYTFVPKAYTEKIKNALFEAGAGNIGAYSECSFSTGGTGTFKAGTGTTPFVGNIGERHLEPEEKIEVIFPAVLQSAIIEALWKAHPYEEVAYDVVPLLNHFNQVGSGIIGSLPHPVEETAFLEKIKHLLKVPVIKHTRLLGKPIQKVAICGGAGSFLTQRAIAAGADIFITADVKYHDFFEANNTIIIADVGHWESEQFTIDLLEAVLQTKFPTFAVLKSKVSTNPIQYFL